MFSISWGVEPALRTWIVPPSQALAHRKSSFFVLIRSLNFSLSGMPQGVFSGTLSYVFNNFSLRNEKFSSIVKEAMEKIVEMDDISKCQLNSDYNYTDTTRKKYRYQAVYDMVHF